jgi:hypothetical protein
MDLTYDMIEKEQSYMESRRADCQKTKQLCIDLTYPERLASWDWLSSASGINTTGKKYSGIVKRVHDGTAKYAFSVWLNGVMGHFYPKQINWFREYYSNRKIKDSKAVIKWLQETDDHMVDVINRSGSVGCDNDYYNQKRWILGDAGCIGDSYLFIQKDKQTGKQFFMAAHPKDCWMKRDFWGRVMGFHYQMSYTMEQVVKEFGMNALSDNQRYIYTGTPEGKRNPVRVIYTCYKNYDYEENRPGTKNMSYQTGYFNMDGKVKILQDGSETINPVPYSMRRPPDSDYGLGLVYSNILECLTVDEIGKTMLMAGQQAVQPSMLVSSAIMNKLNLNPGAVTKVDYKGMQGVKMGDMLSRIVDSSGYPFGAEMQALWQDLLNRRFGVPLFIALLSANASGKTAFEVNQIKAEQSVLMGPQVSEISTMTDMEFDRMYQLELDSNEAPEPPIEVLRDNGRIDLDYVGPLNQLLKQYYESGSLLTTIGYIREVLSVAPYSAIVVEGDELMRKIMRSGNSPEDIILSSTDVQEIRAIQAQMMEEERQSKLLGETSKSVQNMSKKIEKSSLVGQVV